jgi:hypothetical protein
MKFKLIKQTNTSTAEQFLFARNEEANDAQNIMVTLTINSDKRMTSVKVTGSVAAMDELYQRYWLAPLGDD